ncbi:MAG: hypothetical protein KAT15_28890 [Bacteroidales bacterium]|nr:hypothetical protein [Bacteroidales bacterium]
MKRSVLIFILLIAISAKAYSQLFTYGIKAGTNYSWLKLVSSEDLYTSTGGKLGVHGGLFVRKDFGKSFLQVEADLVGNSIRKLNTYHR